ncbi:NAD(P)-dependent alcohol dehydrogenase [Myxococcota bacterium]|nr:NAD(P)-dependent alcohol dehydrogenase [Myxococcota bacterium]
MKILQFDQYGDIDVYQFKELPTPTPQPNEVLLDVRAAAINPLDGKIRKGQMGFMVGNRFPKGVGGDVAGVVVAIGKNVKSLKVGDEVFGVVAMKSPYGSVATQTLAPAHQLALKPKQISFAQAASLPVVANAALVGLRDVLHLKQGQLILLNGCTGGIGIIAIQIAKIMGAHVTGVCATQGVELARSLGADDVIDYKKQDVLQTSKRFDALFELSGRLPFAKARTLLTPKGLFLDPAPSPKTLITSTLANPFRAQKWKMLMADFAPGNLDQLAQWAAQGKLKTHLDKTFPFEQALDAYRYAESQPVQGKVVIAL